MSEHDQAEPKHDQRHGPGQAEPAILITRSSFYLWLFGLFCLGTVAGQIHMGWKLNQLYRPEIEQRDGLIRIQSKVIQGYEDDVAKLAARLGYKVVKKPKKTIPSRWV